MYDARGYFKHLTFSQKKFLIGFISDIDSGDDNEGDFKCLGLYKDQSNNNFIEFQKNDVLVLPNNCSFAYFLDKHVRIEFDKQKSKGNSQSNEEKELLFSINHIEVLD